MTKQRVIEPKINIDIPPPRTFLVKTLDQFNNVIETLVIAHLWNADGAVITFHLWVPATAPGSVEGMIEQRVIRGFREWLEVEEVKDQSSSVN